MHKLKLRNGVEVPAIVISSHVGQNLNKVKDTLRSGFEAGFRSVDTARDYFNEPVVGQALNEVLKETGLTREEITLTTKIGNSQQAKGDIQGEIETSLRNLKTDYIDVWLMHWPYPDFFTKTWRKMRSIYENTDKVKAIGVANFHVRHLRTLYQTSKDFMPMINQVEFHPLRTISDIRAEMKKHNIVLEAYAPLCKYIPALSKAPILINLAEKYAKSVGQIILRWHIQNQSIPVFLTNNPLRFHENIDVFDFELTHDEINLINSLNQDYKFHLESTHCPAY